MKHLLPCLFILAILFFSVSCKKSSGGVQSMLIANWKLEETGVDKNNNGTLDSNEVTYTDSLNDYRQFDSGNTGYDIGVNYGAYPIPFYWQLSQDLHYVRVSDTSISNPNPVIFHIDLITNTQLILRDSIGGVAAWNIYKKS